MNIHWLAWYASFFGVTTDYLLSRDKLDVEIGERLRVAREQTGLSLQAACLLLGASEYALDAIETGDMEMPLGVLQKAGEAYQVIYEYILGIDQGSDASHIATLLQDVNLILLCQEIYNRPELLKIYYLIRGLVEKDVGRLLRVIDCLVNEL